MIDLRFAKEMYVGNKPVKQVYLGNVLIKDFSTVIEPPIDPPIEPPSPLPIYVKLVASDYKTVDVILNCNRTNVNSGQRRTQDYTLYFYSDANYSVPREVTGLPVNISTGKKTQYSGAFTYTTSQVIANGISTVLKSDFLIYEAYRDCSYVEFYSQSTIQVAPASTYTTMATVGEVPPGSAPTYPEIPADPPVELTLKNLTSKFGMAIRADKLGTTSYTNILKKHCRVLGAESAMKPDKINNVRGQITNNADAEAIANFAAANNIDLHFHTTNWAKTSQTQDWVKALVNDTSLTENDWKNILKESVQTLALYAVSLGAKTMDAINEVFNETDDINELGIYRDCIWYQKLGPQYVPLTFIYAHEVAPNVELYMTDYGHKFGGSKMTAYFNLVNQMVADGIPIHGLGYQTHARIGNSRSSIKNGLLRGIATGLKVSITELDMSVRKDQPVGYEFTPELEEIQSQRFLETYLDFDALPEAQKGFFMTWGVYDGQSWLREEGNGDFALLFKKDYSPKLAVQYMIDTIA